MDEGSLVVRWRARDYHFPLAHVSNLHALGMELARVTGAAFATIKLLPPKGDKPIVPASDPTSGLHSVGLGPGSRVLCVASLEEEVASVRRAKDLPGMASFEHELTMLMRRQKRSAAAATLPSGPYTFKSFETWQPPPGVGPPPLQALQLLHRLAADTGIAGVMAGRRWSVGLLAEMPPKGKVGISPVCVLGYNTNKGQSIHLRLRTDDLRGFRQYQRIRETLVHELAHNVHGDHDDAFKALNSELLREVGAHDRRAADAHTLSVLAGGVGDGGFGGASEADGWIDEHDVMAASRVSSGRTLRQLASAGGRGRGIGEPGSSAGVAADESTAVGGLADPRAAAVEAALRRLPTLAALGEPRAAGSGAAAAAVVVEGPSSVASGDGMEEVEEERRQQQEDEGTREDEDALRELGGLPADVPAGRLFAPGGVRTQREQPSPPPPPLQQQEQQQEPRLNEGAAVGRDAAAAVVAAAHAAAPVPCPMPAAANADVVMVDAQAASCVPAAIVAEPATPGPTEEVSPQPHAGSHSREGEVADVDGNATAPSLPSTSQQQRGAADGEAWEAAAADDEQRGEEEKEEEEEDPMLAMGIGPDDPMAQRYTRMAASLMQLTGSAPPGEARQALESLASILHNAATSSSSASASSSSPAGAGGGEKYRRLRLSNPGFARRVGRHPGAVELLLAAGFSEEQQQQGRGSTAVAAGGGGGPGVGVGGGTERVLRLRRDDPALLWLASTAVQRALQRLPSPV